MKLLKNIALSSSKRTNLISLPKEYTEKNKLGVHDPIICAMADGETDLFLVCNNARVKYNKPLRILSTYRLSYQVYTTKLVSGRITNWMYARIYCPDEFMRRNGIPKKGRLDIFETDQDEVLIIRKAATDVKK